jgi:hypothetical protein
MGADYDDTTGTMTVDATGQAPTATWSSCGIWFGSAATLTESTGLPLRHRVTSAFVPSVTLP